FPGRCAVIRHKAQGGGTGPPHGRLCLENRGEGLALTPDASPSGHGPWPCPDRSGRSIGRGGGRMALAVRGHLLATSGGQFGPEFFLAFRCDRAGRRHRWGGECPLAAGV